MEPAAKRLAEVLDDITISDAKIPVVANVNGQIETAAADIKASLIKQAASPVLWIDCTKTMLDFGAENFVESVRVKPFVVLIGKLTAKSTVKM